MIQVVGNVAAVRENRNAAIPRNVAFLFFLVVIAVLAFKHQHRTRRRNRFGVAIFEDKVVAAHQLMFQRHRRRRTFELVAESADIAQVVFIRVLEILRQHDLVVVKFLTALGVGILPFLRRFRTKRQEVFECIQNIRKAGIPRFVLLILH